MIPGVLGSGVAPSKPTISSVLQDQTSAIVNASWGASQNPFGGNGTIEIETSPDGTTWTSRPIVSGAAAIGLNGGSTSSTVGTIATPLLFRVRQILSGLIGEWSASFNFNSDLVSPPVPAPVSVTITNAAYVFGDRYRVSFTVNQSGDAPSGTNREILARLRYGGGDPSNIGSYVILDSGWLNGDTDYTIDIVTSVLTNPEFIVDVYNSAGGYDSTVVSSSQYPEENPSTPIEETVEITAFGETIPDIPAWATEVEYFLIGGSGGGGAGKVTSVGNDFATSLYWVGEPGSAGTLQTGTLSLPITAFNVFIGLGGNGSLRVSGSNPATAGGSSFLRTGTTALVTSAGGAGGADETTAVTFPSAQNQGNPSANVTIDGTTTNGRVGTLIPTGAGWPTATNFANSDSVSIVGGGSGGASFPDAGLADGLSEVFGGGNGGLGYCKLIFKGNV